jgi:ethanolamine ammonia-lyase small subunit
VSPTSGLLTRKGVPAAIAAGRAGCREDGQQVLVQARHAVAPEAAHAPAPGRACRIAGGLRVYPAIGGHVVRRDDHLPILEALGVEG